MAKDKMRNKYQHELNKMLREINKSLRIDPLWRGRFEVVQKDFSFERFEDGSGGIVYYTFRIVDKKDGYYKDFRADYAPWMYSCGWNMFRDVNSFIVNDCNVWEEDPKPDVETAKDYLYSIADEDIVREPYNYFLTKEFFWSDKNK